MDKIVYLAGAMQKAGDLGIIWREEITPHLEGLGYKVWNPYHEEQRAGPTLDELKELKDTNFEEFKRWIAKIVDHDLLELMRCSLVVCKLDSLVGAGTFSELTFCRFKRIPSYVWVDYPGGIQDVPWWTIGCITEWSESKEGFYKIIPKASVL